MGTDPIFLIQVRRKSFPAVMGALALSGCVGIEGDPLGPNYGGRDFPMDKLHAMEPGRTTKADVLRWLGPPEQVQRRTESQDGSGNPLAEPKASETWVYTYHEGGRHGANGEMPHKVARVVLIDSVVISYRSESNFRRSATDFDLDRAFTITKGTSAEEIVAALGAPSGRGIYPRAASPKGTSITYDFSSSPCRSCEGRRKVFSAMLDADGRAEAVQASLWTVPWQPFASPKRLR